MPKARASPKSASFSSPFCREREQQVALGAQRAPQHSPPPQNPLSGAKSPPSGGTRSLLRLIHSEESTACSAFPHLVQNGLICPLGHSETLTGTAHWLLPRPAAWPTRGLALLYPQPATAGEEETAAGALTRLISRFWGFRSRWRTFRLWQNPRPFSSWYMNDWGGGGEEGGISLPAATQAAALPEGARVEAQPPLTFTISGSRSPLQLSKYFFRSWQSEMGQSEQWAEKCSLRGGG